MEPDDYNATGGDKVEKGVEEKTLLVEQADSDGALEDRVMGEGADARHQDARGATDPSLGVVHRV